MNFPPDWLLKMKTEAEWKHFTMHLALTESLSVIMFRLFSVEIEIKLILLSKITKIKKKRVEHIINLNLGLKFIHILKGRLSYHRFLLWWTVNYNNLINYFWTWFESWRTYLRKEENIIIFSICFLTISSFKNNWHLNRLSFLWMNKWDCIQALNLAVDDLNLSIPF